MFSFGRPSLLSPFCGRDAGASRRSPEVVALRRRAEVGWALHRVGLNAIALAGVLALVGFPMPVLDLPPPGVEVTAPPPVSVELAPLSVWPVRFAAAGGFAAHLFGVFLDRHYSEKVLEREEGAEPRGRFLAPSLVSVATAAATTLLIVVLYQGG